MCNDRYERIEIPLHIVPSTSIGQACLESLVELPRIFSQEEEEAYQSLARKPNMDLITKLHNASGRFFMTLNFYFFKFKKKCLMNFIEKLFI